MAEQHRLAINTHGRGSLEITGEIAAIVRNATVDAGIAHVFVRHTSCGLAITENADASVRRENVRASGTTIQPMRQPVIEKYFEKLLMTTA